MKRAKPISISYLDDLFARPRVVIIEEELIEIRKDIGFARFTLVVLPEIVEVKADVRDDVRQIILRRCAANPT